MSIQVFLAMEPGHGSGATCGMVQGVPQSLNDFTVHHACTLDECGGESGVTLLLMPMDVEETDSTFDSEVIGKGEKVPIVDNAFLEVDPVLTHNVV